MTRKGRRRQAGPREPTGRLARAAAEPEKGYAPAAIKRLTDSAIRGMADAAFGTPLGRLYLDGHLNEAQFAAGRRFDRLTRAYLQAIAAPRPDPHSNAPDERARSAEIDPDSDAGQQRAAEHRAIVVATEAARAVLAACGKGAEAAVRGLCEARELPAGWAGHSALAAGLSALAVHWRLGRGGQRRGT